MKSLSFVMLLTIIALHICSYGNSQTNEAGYQAFQFNFFPPGVRAMAMGGAFIGLADDASSAYYNPAGLIILNKAEINLASTIARNKTIVAREPDVFSTGNLTSVESDWGGGPLYASFVIPLENACIGIYYSNIALSGNEVILYYARPVPGTSYIEPPVEDHFDFDNTTLSMAFSLKMSDLISIGATINYVMSSLESHIIYHNINPNDYHDITQDPLFELTSDSTQNGKFGFILGVLLTPIKNLSIGFVCNYTPNLDYTQSKWVPDRMIGINMNDDIHLSINVPNRFAIGVAFRPSDELVIAADAIYTKYSELTEKMISSFDGSNGIKRGDDISVLYAAPNVAELHFGLEYALLTGETPLFIRAGMFINPSHRIRFTGESTTGIEPYLWNLSDYSNDIKDIELAFSGGAGIHLGNNFKIDIAYYASYVHKSFMLSVGYVL
jgi:long-subunit fatty acid transport protein